VVRYLVKCPFCPKTFDSPVKYLIKLATAKLIEHLEQNHLDAVEEWYNEHPKAFRYIKRECIKPFKQAMAVIFTAGGERIRVEKRYEKALREAKTVTELIRTLDRIAENSKSKKGEFNPKEYANFVQANTLRRWIFSYFLRKSGNIVVEREQNPQGG